jgi:hypothetical protein
MMNKTYLDGAVAFLNLFLALPSATDDVALFWPRDLGGVLGAEALLGILNFYYDKCIW